MGEHNALKYGVDITRGYERATGVDELEQGVTRLSETLYGVLDLWRNPEHAFPRKEYRWNVAPSQAAVVAEFSRVGIGNPANINGQPNQLLVVIETIEFLGVAAVADFRIAARAEAAVTATSTPTQADLRIPGFPNPSLSTQSLADHSGAAVGSLLRLVQVAANDGRSVDVNIVLSPGFQLFVEQTVVNTGVQCTFIGRERRAFPGELKP